MGGGPSMGVGVGESPPNIGGGPLGNEGGGGSEEFA